METNEVAQEEYFSKKYKLSWIVYARMVFIHAVFIGVIVYGSSYFPTSDQITILSYLFAFEAIIIPLRVLSMRARYVFIDETGVWYHRGFLPWTKGCNGIVWRDCGGSSYGQGFSAYILNTYTVYIKHKYTESMQIIAHDIYKGKEFCGIVADYLHKLHNNNSNGA